MESVKSFILDVFLWVLLFFLISVAASTILYVIMFLYWLFYRLFLAPKCSNCAKRVVSEETIRCPRCRSFLREAQPQAEMNLELYARVKTLVAKQAGVVEEELMPETHLADDLGIAGDDGYELLEAFCEEFEIQNMEEIDYTEYFGTEGGPNPFEIYVFFYYLVFDREKQHYSCSPLYLRDLVKSAEAKRWIPPET